MGAADDIANMLSCAEVLIHYELMRILVRVHKHTAKYTSTVIRLGNAVWKGKLLQGKQ